MSFMRKVEAPPVSNIMAEKKKNASGATYPPGTTEVGGVTYK